MAEYSYDRKKMEDYASSQDEVKSKEDYMKAMGYKDYEKAKDARDKEYSDYADYAKKAGKKGKDMKKSEEGQDVQVTDEDLLNKAEQIVQEDISNLPSDEQLLAEIDALIAQEDTVEKSQDEDTEEVVEKSEETPKTEDVVEKSDNDRESSTKPKKKKEGEDMGGDDSEEDGGGYKKNPMAPPENFAGEGDVSAPAQNGDDSKEQGGGYMTNPEAPAENFPGNTVAANGAPRPENDNFGGDDSKEDGGGYMQNNWSPQKDYYGKMIKSLDEKFDTLVDCVQTMNDRLDSLAEKQEEIEKSQKDEVADEIIEKSQKDEKDDLTKSFSTQIEELTKAVKTVFDQNAELQKSLKSPARTRQSLSNYQQIEKSQTKTGAQTMNKSQQLAKLDKLFKSGRKDLGNDIIKLNSTGILSDKAREALEEA